MVTLDSLFEQFVRERTYLHNVTPKTRDWYQTAWKAFKRFQADAPARPTNAPLISRLDLQQFVVHLREAPPGFGARTTISDCYVIAREEIVVAVHGIRANRYLTSSQRPSFFARSI